MLQENISEQNAFVRLMLGVIMTGYGVAKIARKPNCMTGSVMIMAGAMKVAEGLYQYCPVTAMVNPEAAEKVEASSCQCD